MTARGLYTLLFAALMLITALSVGSAGAFLLGVAALCALAVSLVSVLFAAGTLRLAQSADSEKVQRGDALAYTLQAQLFTPLPIAPLSLHMRLPSGRESEYLLASRLFGTTVSENAFSCPHVGLCEVGVTRCDLTDCFALFTLRLRVRMPLLKVTVLPVPAQADKPAFSPGEGEHSITQRALSDHTTPVDTRPWQDGDELKRVHWKLSMRRQSLMVHTYETPQRPDALLLLDCAAPGCAPARAAFVIDCLTEECAGAAQVLLADGHPVRMPLSSSTAREVSGQDAKALTGFQEALAQTAFDAPADFERVLLLASRRMRRTGATLAYTSRLTPRVADALIALSRMGPRTALTLVTDGEVTDEQQKLLHLLQNSGVTARHVRCL